MLPRCGGPMSRPLQNMPFKRKAKKRHNLNIRKGECVYLIAAGDAVKIGYSRNVSKRVEQLQTGCSERIRLVKTWFDDRARKIEVIAHHFLKPYRTDGKGEWFYVKPTLAEIIINELFVQFPRNPANRPEKKIMLMCQSCGHGGLILNSTAARFRCSACNELREIRHHVFPCQVEPHPETSTSTGIS